MYSRNNEQLERQDNNPRHIYMSGDVAGTAYVVMQLLQLHSGGMYVLLSACIDKVLLCDAMSNPQECFWYTALQLRMLNCQSMMNSCLSLSDKEQIVHVKCWSSHVIMSMKLGMRAVSNHGILHDTRQAFMLRLPALQCMVHLQQTLETAGACIQGAAGILKGLPQRMHALLFAYELSISIVPSSKQAGGSVGRKAFAMLPATMPYGSGISVVNRGGINLASPLGLPQASESTQQHVPADVSCEVPEGIMFSQTTLNPQNLADLPLITIVKCLTREDRLRLAECCRELAMAVSAVSSGMELSVTSKTGWTGLYKVLGTRTLCCKAMRITGDVIPHEHLTRSNALDILLRPQPVFGCSFRGIKHVHIMAQPLPCLLPPNIARMLPDLESLSVVRKLGPYADLQPIPYCSSLRKLSYVDTSDVPQLPSSYHTADDLRRQLPNIDTLELGMVGLNYRVPAKKACEHAMLKAWGDQLTELECDVNLASSVLLQFTRLHSLTLTRASVLPSCDFPPSLRTLKLKLTAVLQESDLNSILKLSCLRALTIVGFTNSLQQDWSKHACTLQQLTANHLHMSDLGKLPLSSLKGEGCLTVNTLKLPNPRLPGSMDDVRHAASCVSDAGITVEDFKAWECDQWIYGSAGDAERDAACAELLRAASRVVQPFTVYQSNTFALTAYPQSMTAVIEWSSSVLQELRIKQHALALPWIWPCEHLEWLWQALKCCCKLQLVEADFCGELWLGDNRYINEDDHICIIIHMWLAVSYLKDTIHGPLTLTFESYCCDNPTQALAYLKRELLDMLQPRSARLQKCEFRAYGGNRGYG